VICSFAPKMSVHELSNETTYLLFCGYYKKYSALYYIALSFEVNVQLLTQFVIFLKHPLIQAA
jgi:hypothetical protein